MSPSIFNVFVNIFITRLRLLGWGCHINGVFVGCIMYADDLILLCPTVCGLQAMLNCCSDVSIELLLTFNCGKSSCAAIGPGALLPITEMQIAADRVAWSDSLKYLGVIYFTGLNLTVNLSCLKMKFFCACNSIFGNTCGLDELLQLRLHESYSLPILQYATVAVRLNKSQVAELNTCWNAVYRLIFGFRKSEPIRVFIVGLG